MGRLADTYGTLLEAVSFAARAHDGQLRKDNRTPYVAHVFRVSLVVRHVFGLDDERALMAALLHDTIEDTRTDCDDLLQFLGGVGHPVADWVVALSKDKRREEGPARPPIWPPWRLHPGRSRCASWPTCSTTSSTPVNSPPSRCSVPSAAPATPSPSCRSVLPRF